MRKKPWKREVKYLYKMFMQQPGRTTDIKKTIGYFSKYNEIVETARYDPDCPKAVRGCFATMGGMIKMPKYFTWAKQFMVHRKK
jgi:hypothetical protein